MQLTPNTELQGGKYRIIRVLGQGGFGITYLAEHTMLDKMVAIKEFFPKEYCDRDQTTSHITIGTKNSVEIVEMLKGKFIKEAKNISKLNHKNIITIHDIFQENETAYYVMEFVEGSSLSEMVKRNGALPEEEAIGYIRKISDAVGYMHGLSMNHLDLKPANIMVRSADGEPILIDFGLSKQYDASGGQTSTTPVGISHGYAPIEQYKPGGVATFTPQTDIYALGATLFNLLSGSVPPHYSEILEDGLPELPASVTKRCFNAIEHAMEVKKNKRPATVAEFLSELIEKVNNEPKTIIVTEVSETIPEDNKPAPTPRVENQIPKQAPKQTEETILISPQNQVQESIITNSIIINNTEFIDLGLSVLWANKNIGADYPEKPGTLINKNDSNCTSLVADWNLKGCLIPTIAQFDELVHRCHWHKSDEKNGYIVKGPNGNKILLPFSGDANFLFSNYGLLFTRESYFNDLTMNRYYLYFNSSCYKLSNYSTDYTCPIRLIIPK